MPEERQEEETGEGIRETGSSTFDHQNVRQMDRQFIVTMNNEHVVDGYTPSADIYLTKLQAEEMKLMELIDAGEVDVDTARAIMGGTFTLLRAIDRSRDGFERRMKQSAYSYELYVPPPKAKGFLSRLNPFNRDQPQQYPVERR